MRPLIAIRAALVAFALIGVGLATAAYADGGSIRFNVVNAGFVIGGSAGSGAMNFHGPDLSTHHWRSELRIYLWRLGDRFRRERHQHPDAI
jgi:hypothetical protein